MKCAASSSISVATGQPRPPLLEQGNAAKQPPVVKTSSSSVELTSSGASSGDASTIDRAAWMNNRACLKLTATPTE
jgi:hypothetical protein